MMIFKDKVVIFKLKFFSVSEKIDLSDIIRAIYSEKINYQINITEERVLSIIKELLNKKILEHSEISNKILKIMRRLLIRALTRLIKVY